ncbi:restriction endonuclease subunit S [Anaerobutyricum hallii]|uniref:restriction endonuclease subunit S n=1 Tax=Anaerobutyricum hallii TaxID=39488 RepID=UPI0035228040
MGNTPNVRFKGFTEDWEQRKLGDVFEQTSNLVNPKEDEIELWSLTVEDGLTKKSDRYNREFLVKKDDNFKEVRPGDIVYNPMNMTLGAVGYNGMTKSVAVSGYYTTMIAKENYDTYYINTWLKSSQAIRLYRTYATGSLIEKQRVQFPTLSIIPVAFPKYEEQTMIGRYFSNLDHLITLHQQKCDEIKELKKYMLQNMFPQKDEKVPKIRFAGFTGDWEQRKWMNSVDISTEMVDPASGEYDDMPHIAPGNIESFTGRILDNVRTVKEEQLISGKFRFRPDDVVYGKINPQLGKYFYASVDGLTSADAYVFKGKNGITQKFLFSVIQTSDFFKYSVSVSKRSGMPKINRDELNAYAFLAPSEEEQDKIGNFLLEIDHLITLHQQKCAALKESKKYMLQNMFPQKGENKCQN